MLVVVASMSCVCLAQCEISRTAHDLCRTPSTSDENAAEVDNANAMAGKALLQPAGSASAADAGHARPATTQGNSAATTQRAFDHATLTGHAPACVAGQPRLVADVARGHVVCAQAQHDHIARLQRRRAPIHRIRPHQAGQDGACWSDSLAQDGESAYPHRIWASASQGRCGAAKNTHHLKAEKSD